MAKKSRRYEGAAPTPKKRTREYDSSPGPRHLFRRDVKLDPGQVQDLRWDREGVSRHVKESQAEWVRRKTKPKAPTSPKRKRL
jgi:hypothetical protein